MPARIRIGAYAYTCQPRWGHGAPPHRRLVALVEAQRAEYVRRLEGFAALAPLLAGIAKQAPDDSPVPRWDNPWFTGLDAVALVGMLKRHDPRRLIEIGSGNSTRFARHAVTALGLRTRIISVDPEPRAGIDSLCDEVIRAPAETVDPALFERLKPGDILFVDSSHRSLQNSDVTALFLDVLPELPPGVIVHVHDVYLPADYPPAAEGLMYNEQYLLAALMLGEGRWLEPVMPNQFVLNDPRLSLLTLPLWAAIGVSTFPAPANSFWLNIKKHR